LPLVSLAAPHERHPATSPSFYPRHVPEPRSTDACRRIIPSIAPYIYESTDVGPCIGPRRHDHGSRRNDLEAHDAGANCGPRGGGADGRGLQLRLIAEPAGERPVGERERRRGIG